MRTISCLIKTFMFTHMLTYMYAYFNMHVNMQVKMHVNIHVSNLPIMSRLIGKTSEHSYMLVNINLKGLVNIHT